MGVDGTAIAMNETGRQMDVLERATAMKEIGTAETGSLVIAETREETRLLRVTATVVT